MRSRSRDFAAGPRSVACGLEKSRGLGACATGTFTAAGFDAHAEFVRADTQKLSGVANRAPADHGTSVRILFDSQVAADSVIDIGEVLLRAHAAARMCPGVHLHVVDEGWPLDKACLLGLENRSSIN